MNEKKESTTKKIGRFIGKKAVDASRLIDHEMRKAGRIAREELKDLDIGNIIVEPIKRPKNESRIQFTNRTRPTKTYTQANKTIQFFSRNPEKEVMNPGIDGLVSFSLLIAPFAALVGILILVIDFPKTIAILLLFLYTLLIAIPGAYLGVDAILAGARSVIVGSTTTIMMMLRGFGEFIFLMAKGFVELCVLLLTNIFGFARGAFETITDYIAFILVYGIFTVGLWILLLNIGLETSDFIIISFIVLLPALLPASIAHRYWVLWRMNRRSN